MKRASMMLVAGLAALIVSGSAHTADLQPGWKYGSVSYPAPGNFDLDEGTMEMWVAADMDTEDKKFGAMLFDLQAPQGESWHYPIMFVGGSIAQIGYCKPRHSYVWAGKANWKAGEQHYFVFTWSGRARSIYIDGKHIETTKAQGPLQGEGRGYSSKDVMVEGFLNGQMTGATLMVGGQYSPITLDEVRISSVAKTEEEVSAIFAAKKAPMREPTTLLLDHCDGGPAEVVSGFSGEKGAKIKGETKVVDGHFGKAIQLWTKQ